MKIIGLKIGAILGIAALALAIAPADSQKARASSTKTKVRHQQTSPVTIGDIEITGSQSIHGSFNQVVIEGPNSTVDVINPSEPNTKTRVQAAKMTVYFDEKSHAATRMEAEGNFRFSGTRPTSDKKTTQNFSGTGTKAIYYKSDGRLHIEGPVSFKGEQPSSDGKNSKTVNGTASSATFNEQTEVLTLEGGFKALFTDPATIAPPGANIAGGKLVADLSKSPVEFRITPDRGFEKITFTPVEKPKKKENK